MSEKQKTDSFAQIFLKALIMGSGFALSSYAIKHLLDSAGAKKNCL